MGEMFHFTESAMRKLAEISHEGSIIRLDVTNKGCGGFTYDINRVSEPSRGDELIDVQEGVRFAVSARAMLKVWGSTLDWREEGMSRRFVLDNPNEKGKCGCGESFSL
jgi:iron-sulfur cluster assembly protein